MTRAPSASTAAQIEAALRRALTPSALTVRDDSAAHAGHAGAGAGGHFTVALTSERFRGLTRLARHRLVYDAVASLMTQGIHALAIEAKSPEEA